MMRSFAVLALTGAVLTGCSSVNDVLASPEPNLGPCPTALSLYDAHRMVELVDDTLTYESIGFTGEILGVRSLCTYYGDNPIVANLEIDFGFGRGPSANGQSKTYEYWVAVTRRDIGVVHKETFPLTIRFDSDEDRVFMTETIGSITIPRAQPDTSGANFEILVGFELTDEQLAYNRSGQRFRVIAGQD